MTSFSGILKRAKDGSNDEETREFFSTCLLFMLITALGVAALLWLSEPTQWGADFSASVTDVGGLDDLVQSPVIHPVFDVTLRVNNDQSIEICREKVTVTVSYGGVVLGWGDMRDFCVDKWASVELKATMSHADVMLTDQLRASMASKLHAGELEVSVEMRMSFPAGNECFYCSPQSLQIQFCPVKPGQGYSYCQCYV